MLDRFTLTFIILGITFVFILFVSFFAKVKPAGQAAEEETLRIIKNFLKNNHYKREDYLLVNNLILQKENYWSCEIDLLLLTKKWIYVIEVKDWGRGRLAGNFNHEYLEWSYKVGKQRRHQRHRMYSPFWQNETHIKRFKSYFGLASNQNILGIVVFNSPYLEIALKENKKSVFENRHVWTRNIAYWLARCEKLNTQLNSFEWLKEKVEKEIAIVDPHKSQRHRAWVKEAKEGKELREMLR